MRILCENKIEHSAVSAENATNNYPPSAIWDEFLQKKYKGGFSDDVLTIDLEEISDVNCFFMAFHNVREGSVVFFDENLDPIGPTIDLADADDIFVSYFDTISVRRIVVTVDSLMGQVYIGGIGAGVYTQMPNNITLGFEYAISDATEIQQSPAGQTSRNKAPSLRLRSFTWPNLTAAERDAIDVPLRAMGIGKPVYIDLFENNRSEDVPMFGFVTEPRRITRPAANRFDLYLTLQEAQ